MPVVFWSDDVEAYGFTAAARQIASKLAPTASGQNQKLSIRTRYRGFGQNQKQRVNLYCSLIPCHPHNIFANQYLPGFHLIL